MRFNIATQTTKRQAAESLTRCLLAREKIDVFDKERKINIELRWDSGD